jgi:hypothetical protein
VSPRDGLTPSSFRRAIALAALALAGVAAAAAAAPAGTAARLQIPGAGALELWRGASGEIGVIPSGEPGVVVRVHGLTIAFADGAGGSAGTVRLPTRERLSRTLAVELGADLPAIEAALAAGAPAPEPAWIRRARRDQRQAPDATLVVDLGSDVRALARGARRRVAWLGPRAAGLPLHAAQLVTVRQRGGRRGGPAAVVVYAPPAFEIEGAAFSAAAPSTAVTSVPADSPEGRAIVAALRPEPGFGGRRVRLMPSGLELRAGPLAVRIRTSLGSGRLPALVRALRLSAPAGTRG